MCVQVQFALEEEFRYYLYGIRVCEELSKKVLVLVRISACLDLYSTSTCTTVHSTSTSRALCIVQVLASTQYDTV